MKTTVSVFRKTAMNSQEVYSVMINNEHIYTVVTKNASTVKRWIDRICKDYNDHLNHLIVGLDVEWKPAYGPYRNRIATLQLCVGRRCLIFQMIHADEIPESLSGFLSNPYFKFVGVGIQSDVDKLGCDYNIGVMNAFDLGNLAAAKYGNKGFKNVGLMVLAEVILGCGEIEKPRNVTMSNWDQYHLTEAQIRYACIDAYVSFKIGKQLLQV
ncbi:hypothetical protein MKW92_033688 [Papaver armeniacum]|nr:hypothetical protein MKW92_033688 [Papaver armeniacum]